MWDENWYEKEQLHFAAQDGDLAQIERLIAQGRDVNALDSLGKTPLHLAAKGEHLDAVALLIEHGADVNAHHEPVIGETPLGEIASNCSFEMANLLVDAGADPSIPGWMQLKCAGSSKQPEAGRWAASLWPPQSGSRAQTHLVPDRLESNPNCKPILVPSEPRSGWLRRSRGCKAVDTANRPDPVLRESRSAYQRCAFHASRSASG